MIIEKNNKLKRLHHRKRIIVQYTTWLVRDKEGYKNEQVYFCKAIHHWRIFTLHQERKQRKKIDQFFFPVDH